MTRYRETNGHAQEEVFSPFALEAMDAPPRPSEGYEETPWQLETSTPFREETGAFEPEMEAPSEDEHETPFLAEADEEMAEEADFAGEENEEETAHTCHECGERRQGLLFEMEEQTSTLMRSVEKGMVLGFVAAGQRDPNKLTDTVFYMRHPELKSQRIGADDTALKQEWWSIRNNIVEPALGSTAPAVVPAAPAAAGDQDVRLARAIGKKPVPGMPGVTIEQLIEQHRVRICPEIPLPLLLAFMRYESGGRFNDATHGTPRNNYTSPPFYELGLFQTPAGQHGHCASGDPGSCQHAPPGREIPGEPSQWARLCAQIGADPSDWTNPATQVQVGLLDLRTTADRIRKDYADLFPSRGSEWDLRMAVLQSFSRGGGYVRSFLRPFRAALLAMPESERWSFLRGQRVQVQGGTRVFDGSNVDKKMALAARLGGMPALITQEVPAVLPPSAAKIASFAVPSPRGYNLRGGRRKQPVFGIIVHTTGSGPADIAKNKARTRARLGCSSAADCALALYARGEGFPHYVIDYDGTVYATCPETHVAWHAGWTKQMGGRARWSRWSPPAWWSKVWGSNKTPLDLIPRGAGSPNSRHIGVELLGGLPAGPFKDAQYQALARLVVDIDKRYQLGIDRAPSAKLLGHEDVAPVPTDEGGRANRHGGWDPGAHRADGVKPHFSWNKLWAMIEQQRTTHELQLEGEEVYGAGETYLYETRADETELLA